MRNPWVALECGFLVTMLIGCKSSNEIPSIASGNPSIATVSISAPQSSQSARTQEPSNADAKHQPIPEPFIGKRVWRRWKNSVVKVSEDAGVVAIWTDVFEPPEQEDGAETRYLFAKRVEDDTEFFRLMLEYPAGNKEHQLCRPRWDECPEAVLRQRREREQQFLSRYHWNELNYFVMEYVTKGDEFHTCERPQRLAFSDMDITFDDLILRISKPSGGVLLERKLLGWNALIKPSRPGAPTEYYVMLAAIDFSRRVLVLALDYCAPGSATDFNLRFHAVRLPQL